MIQISLAAARVNAQLTQDEVSKALKVGKQTIVNWEKGDSEPKVSQAMALSNLYNMPLDAIFIPKNLALSEKDDDEDEDEYKRLYFKN